MLQKIGIISTLVLGFSGCFSNHYYLLSTPPQPASIYAHAPLSIGVEKVTLPKYLFEKEIAIATSNNKITFLADGQWAEALDEGLTRRLISFLQKKFNQPTIYAYPWETPKQPTLTLSVHISRFIVQKNTLYLDASWQIKTRSGIKTSKLFSTTSALTKHNTASIVHVMDSAFSALEKDIAKEIYNRP